MARHVGTSLHQPPPASTSLHQPPPASTSLHQPPPASTLQQPPAAPGLRRRVDAAPQRLGELVIRALLRSPTGSLHLSVAFLLQPSATTYYLDGHRICNDVLDNYLFCCLLLQCRCVESQTSLVSAFVVRSLGTTCCNMRSQCPRCTGRTRRVKAMSHS